MFKEKVTMLALWIGIDVSKKKLDASYLDQSGKYRVAGFANNNNGYEKLLNWCMAAAEDAKLCFCMEATGDYHLNLALYLTEASYHVSVVNPANVKYFGMGQGRLNKSDKADAKLICDYGRVQQPPAWDLASPIKCSLFRLNRRRRQLNEMISAEMCRRECPEAVGPLVMASIKSTLKALRAGRREVEAQIQAIIDSEPVLVHRFELLRSLGTFGLACFLAIVAELPEIERCENAKSYAASAGGNPLTKQSGSSLSQTSISRGGRRHARATFWMPVLSMRATVPELGALYERLRAKGKTHKQAMLACVHKVFMIIYGMLKSNTPYNTRANIDAVKAVA
jgi:transposase